jgi:ABC-type hemin transport system substrate-binding protein
LFIIDLQIPRRVLLPEDITRHDAARASARDQEGGRERPFRLPDDVVVLVAEEGGDVAVAGRDADEGACVAGGRAAEKAHHGYAGHGHGAVEDYDAAAVVVVV